MKKLWISFLVLSVFIGQIQDITAAKRPKNVILMIGDGMGLAQMYTGMVKNGNKLSLERCTYTGLMKTYSANNFTTDSGAGGTAIATGVKTKNGMIGMNPDSVAVESILEKAEKNNLATGMVVACAVTHATPATFIAHQVNRNMYEEIAADYLKTDIDVFIGGGKKYFSDRVDGKNLIQSLEKRDYQMVYSQEELNKISKGKVAGLLYDDHNPPMPQRGNMLPVSTAKAIELLDDNHKGFFMMIEGSQIDWACHANDSDWVAREVIDFDKTVGVALDYAAKSKNTLVIVTADHETGGLTLPKGDIKEEKYESEFSTKDHSGVPVIVYAYGPGAEQFKGFMENTDIKGKIESLLKLK